MRKLLAISFLLVSNLLWAESPEGGGLTPVKQEDSAKGGSESPERYRVVETSNDSLKELRFLKPSPLGGALPAIDKPELAIESHLVLRKKVNSEQYSFYASKPNTSALSELYQFQIPVSENTLMTKFYGKKRGRSYDDAVDVYFSKGAIYSSKYSTLFYFSGEKMERLDATKNFPGAYGVSGSPEGTEVHTEAGELLGEFPYFSSFENVGLKLVKVSREGYMPKLIPIVLNDRELTNVSANLAVAESVEPSVIDKVEFKMIDTNSISLLDSLLNSVEVSMEMNESLLQVMRDKFLKQYYPVEKMTSSARMYQEQWQEYNEKYKNFREIAFLKHANLAIAKQIHNEEFRAMLLDSLSVLEKQEKDVVLQDVPAWGRWDSLGNFQVRARLQGLSNELDALWLGTFDLDSAGQYWFVQQAESDSDSSSLKFKVEYENKPIRFKSAKKIERKYYRLKKMFLEYEGKWIEGVGKFDLAPEVENHPEAIAWLRADSIDAAQLLALKEKEARQAALRKIEEQERLYRNLLIEARGDLVDLPGGTFVFDGNKVELSPFSIQKNELTNELYSRVVGVEMPTELSAEEPKVKINWDSAQSVCKQMGGGLPTEAQWEFAARSGSTTYFYWGDRSSDAVPFAVYEVSGMEKAQVVASRESNSFGLYDMAGNVSEWVYDAEGFFNFLSFVSKQNPDGPSHWLAGDRRIKGGDFSSSKVELRHTSYDYEDPRYFSNKLGFRCVFNDHPTLEELQTQVELYEKKKLENLKED